MKFQLGEIKAVQEIMVSCNYSKIPRGNCCPFINMAAFSSLILVSGILATFIGAICIRLKEIYFSFLTLAFQMVLYSIIIALVITGIIILI